MDRERGGHRQKSWNSAVPGHLSNLAGYGRHRPRSAFATLRVGFERGVDHPVDRGVDAKLGVLNLTQSDLARPSGTVYGKEPFSVYLRSEEVGLPE